MHQMCHAITLSGRIEWMKMHAIAFSECWMALLTGEAARRHSDSFLQKLPAPYNCFIQFGFQACTAVACGALKACKISVQMRINDANRTQIAWNKKCMQFSD